MWETEEKTVPNSEPDPTPWQLYGDWEEADLAEAEDADPDKFEDAFRSGPQPQREEKSVAEYFSAWFNNRRNKS